jgi:hypothetical protein
VQLLLVFLEVLSPVYRSLPALKKLSSHGLELGGFQGVVGAVFSLHFGHPFAKRDTIGFLLASFYQRLCPFHRKITDRLSTRPVAELSPNGAFVIVSR